MDESSQPAPSAVAEVHGGNGAPEPKAAPEAPPKQYRASLSNTVLPAEFAEALLALEKSLGVDLWLLVQDGNVGNDLCDQVEETFFKGRHSLPQGKPVALLIESPGGDASCAYRIAKLLQRRCGSFSVVVVNWAKSAATLLSLGATEIVMGEHAQLGPLDVQIFDPEREDMNSALNETQAFERLHAAGLEAFDQTMMLLKMRTGKRTDAILPHVLRFISDSMRPLLEKVDVVQYTNRLRTLKVAEEYAIRLLGPNYPPTAVKKMARRLVEKYPEHGFVIDIDEARAIGLNVKEPSAEQSQYLDVILSHVMTLNALGRVVQT